MTHPSSRFGITLFDDADGSYDSVTWQNNNANFLDLNVNAVQTPSGPPAAGAFDGQWLSWPFGSAGSYGFLRYDLATNNWKYVRSDFTSRGYDSQFANTGFSLMSGGGSGQGAFSLNSVSVAYRVQRNYRIVSQGNFMLLGSQAANTVIDIHHALIPTTGGLTNPLISSTNLLGYRYQTVASSNVGQRIPFYVVADFSSEAMNSGVLDHVDHVIQIDRSQLTSGAQLGINSTTAANGFNKMFFYDLGNTSF